MVPITSPTQRITVTADMLWELTREYPEAEQRIWRGAEMVGLVERTATPGLCLVGSAHDPDAAYQVDAYGCSCWDFQKRGGFCKHRAARALFLVAERAEAEHLDPTLAPIAYELTDQARAVLDAEAVLDDQRQRDAARCPTCNDYKLHGSLLCGGERCDQTTARPGEAGRGEAGQGMARRGMAGVAR